MHELRRFHIDAKAALLIAVGSGIIATQVGPLLAVALCPALTLNQATGKVEQLSP